MVRWMVAQEPRRTTLPALAAIGNGLAAVNEHGETALEKLGTRAVTRRGDTLFNEGDPANMVYMVVSGAVRTSKLMPDGRRHVVDFLFPGDMFGVNDAEHRATTAEVLCDSIVTRYPRAAFDRAIQDNPRFGRYVLSMLCGGLTMAQDRMLLLGRKTAVEKIASFLLMMADRDASERIELPMTRADIGDYLGLTLETVSRVMTQLKTEKLIQLPDPVHVVITNRAELEAIADGA